MLISLYAPKWAGLFVFCTVSVRRCMNSYSTTNGNEFLFWLLAVSANEAKRLPLKMGLPSLRVYYVWFYPAPTRRVFLYFASMCKQVYSLLPHHYWQGSFALDCCSVTNNEAKIPPLEKGLPSVGVAF